MGSQKVQRSMISLDTNLLIRFFTNDDKAQAQYAVQLIENNEIFISKTVILETEWVLRYSYELDQKIILAAFEQLFGIPQVKAEDPSCVFQALRWYKAGMDFADALHLSSSSKAKKFATLDKKLINKAKKLGVKMLLFNANLFK